MQQGKKRHLRGFTLLELIIVVAILAIIAGGLIVNLSGILDSTSEDLSGSELTTLREALGSFRRDTGFLPGQGPFALLGDHDAAVIDPADPAHWPVYLSTATAAEREAWFRSPANFYMLYVNPLENTGHPLAVWDRSARRGWRGPYLRRDGEGFVRVRDGLASTGIGSPASGSALPAMPSVADVFTHQPLADGTYGFSSTFVDEIHNRWGRPYLLLDTVHPDPMSVTAEERRQYVRDRARLVGLGANGTYNDTDGDLADTGDDLILHLLR